MSSASRGLAPREGLECLLVKMGRTGPLVEHAVGRRQASLGTPVPRTPAQCPQQDRTRLHYWFLSPALD